MKTLLHVLIGSVLALLMIEAADAQETQAVVAPVTVSEPVTIVDNRDTWTLNNGIVKLTISKNGVPRAIIYKGVNIVGHPEGWEQYPSGQVTQSVTINPGTNDGERGEVTVKGVNGKIDME